MKHSRSTFAFTPELGAKLRALRRRRNLTMKGPVVLMDRDSPGTFEGMRKCGTLGLAKGPMASPRLRP